MPAFLPAFEVRTTSPLYVIRGRPHLRWGVFMYWLLLIIAGVLEAGWLIGIEKSEAFSKIPYVVFAVACMSASLLLFGMSLKQIPAPMAYLVWLAVGVLSITLIKYAFFGYSISAKQLLCFALILAGVAGLKLSG